MVRTRHSGEIDTDSPPAFISLANEKSRRALKGGEQAAGVGEQSERAYTDAGDAYNIFEEKIVESRLRPRIGPSRAYNYIDVDSSDEEIIRRRHRHLPLQEYSSERRRSRYSRSRQIKQEMLDKQERPRRILRRQSPPHEDMEEQSTEEEDEDSGTRRTRRQRNSGDIDEDDGEEKNNRTSSGRLSLEDHEGNTNLGSRSLRKRAQCSAQDDEESRVHSLQQRPAIEDEEEHLIRRSSRTRRQVYDTLNQSYLVSIPGRSRRSSGENNEHSDTKDQDSDDNQEYSDMYSRVKRKRVQVKRNMYGTPVMDDSDSEQDVAKRSQNNNNNDDDEDNCDDDDDGEDNMKDAESSNRRVTRQKNHSHHKKQPEIVKSYSLREHKPRTVLYKAPVEERRNKRIHGSIFASTSAKKCISQTYHSPAHKRNIRKRSAFHSSSSSTSSDSESSDEKSFNRRKNKSMDKARSRMMPMNFDSNALSSANVVKDRVKAGASLADIEPMTIDRNVTFSSIGGLGKQIRALKEMIVFPLLYDEVFQRFKVDPPRGVLFYGPPGTGKTLVARALANECSKGDRKVAFFMRKGADCLSKWVGESERQLRLLFDQAYRYRPSIIFFDEIDGLAPVRSSRQDQIHSSIVSTLLALMDGLDSRGEIVVIGATNRIDSLDPALRRPGRFDREFLFALPSLEARTQILKIHTAAWTPKLSDSFISELAEKCVGYCGADLKALCTEATMLALRRRYPQIYVSNEALQLDVSSISVSAKDFFDAVSNIIPTSQRAVSTPARALPARISPLLQQQLTRVMRQLSDIFPHCPTHSSSQDTAADQIQALTESGIVWDEFASDEDDDAPSIYEKSTSSKGSKMNRRSIDDGLGTSQSSTTPVYLNFLSSATCRPATFRPRLMVAGKAGQGQSTYIAPAVIHKMEHLPVHVLDLPTLYAVTAKTPEESCANVFHEAKRKCPSIIYMPYINQWWEVMGETVKATLLTLIQNIDPTLPLLLLATSEQPYHMLDPVLRSLFGQLSGEVVHMVNPSMEERRAFFLDLLLTQAVRPPPQKKQAAQRMLEVLPKAAPPKPRELTKEELAQLAEKEELTLMELRIFLRDVLNKLGSDKKFSIFAKPVNIEDAADYYQIIEHPMDLSTMMAKIDLHEYSTVQAFMQDIDLICSNALEYNPNRGPMDRIIRHRACALKDTAYAIIKTDLDKDFEKTCVEIEESRKRRGEKSATVPNFYYTRPVNQQQTATRNQAATPSYLENPKPVRFIPKPEGERFSRRVRGLNIDPVPPLEVVEKVYKVSRVGGQPFQDNKNSRDESEAAYSNSRVESLLSREEKVIAAEGKMDEDKRIVALPSAPSNKRKKVIKCVWCKPRRKRPRLSASKPCASQASEEEDEEETCQEEQDHDGHKSETQQLVVDVSEQEVLSELKDMRSPERMCTRNRSPAYVGPAAACPSRVSTRRSSLSPRGGSLSHPSPSGQLQVNADQAESSDAAVSELCSKSKGGESSVSEHCSKSDKDSEASDQCLQMKENETAVSEHCLRSRNKEENTDKQDIGSSCHQSEVGGDLPAQPAEPFEKPRVVKRLDLESVAVDSGVGSSVDSNGDSHDGMDHKGEGEPTARTAPISSVTQDCSQNSGSRVLKERAGLILNEPHRKVVVDVNRLTSLLNCLVAQTDGCSVERLEKIYSHLSQIIYRHRHEYDRTAMVLELSHKVDEQMNVGSSLSSPSHLNSMENSAA